jgi:hypothetical protein
MVKPEYYILIGGSETGPWTLRQVQAFWRAGAVTVKTLYAQPGAAEWKPLAAILDAATMPETPTQQSENGPAATVADDASSIPEQPMEMDLTKLRLWLLENLAAIGLALDAEMTAAKQRKFEDWMCRFTGDEQSAIFGANNIHLYRIGDLTWLGLISELKNLAFSAAKKTTGEGDEFAPRNALWIMDAVCGAEPTLELDVEKCRRMGEESAKRANADALKRRADTIAEQLGIKSSGAFKAGE